MKKYVALLLVALILCVGAEVHAQDVEATDGAFYEYDELAGAWRTSEDDEGIVTLILYPEDAFRLYQYHKNDDETFMLEGVRVVENDVIIVSDIRLGMLDAEGAYTQTGYKDTTRFLFSLDTDDAPTLMLTNEEGDTIILYQVDLDGPG